MMNLLDTLHDQVLITLQQAIPELKTCIEIFDDTQMPQKRLNLEAPAVLVTTSELETEPADGTDRFILKTQWQATCIVDGASAQERARAARLLALQVATIIHTNRFQVQCIDPAYVQTIKSQTLDEELKHSAAAWQVTWSQRIYMNDKTQDIRGSLPQAVQLSEHVRYWSPNV